MSVWAKAPDPNSKGFANASKRAPIGSIGAVKRVVTTAPVRAPVKYASLVSAYAKSAEPAPNALPTADTTSAAATAGAGSDSKSSASATVHVTTNPSNLKIINAKSKRGGVLRIIRECYIRSDIGCRSALCSIVACGCKPVAAPASEAAATASANTLVHTPRINILPSGVSGSGSGGGGGGCFLSASATHYLLPDANV